jgi:hypothetical protein
MNDTQSFDTLANTIKGRVPGFQIKFKNESPFMKFLGKIMFFNKSFMTNYVTTIGKTIYFTDRKEFEKNRGSYFKTLCHEYVHVMDYVQRPICFILGYIFPQFLSIFSLGAILAVINPWFLLFLLALLFAAPIPSPGRAETEFRGYGMSCKVRIWGGEIIDAGLLNRYADAFTTSAYYFMWPFRKNVDERLREYINTDVCLRDCNPAYADVYCIIGA